MGGDEAEIVQGTEHRQVSVLLRDQRADRCVLILAEASLTPLAGIRPFANIAVGERAYSVGAPWGRELTIGEGTVSALHPNNGFPLVQTTAPILPGSSGGALVDARGNLLGIVSFRVREDNAMGFALAAESFWAPRQ
ncbi:MAG: Trypsin-like serine protease [Rubritepida sp.]|nr:Trypsin-like serine protease [Rubritepida sp.]